MHGWMDGWMDGCMHACMHAWIHGAIHIVCIKAQKCKQRGPYFMHCQTFIMVNGIFFAKYDDAVNAITYLYVYVYVYGIQN